MSTNSLAPGQSLQNNQSITSTDGSFMLIMQDDGNLVVYQLQPRKPIWASQTANMGGKQAIMQLDGNFVVYDGNGTAPKDALWASNTSTPNSTLFMQDDGNLVIYGPGKPTWATGTNQ